MIAELREYKIPASLTVLSFLILAGLAIADIISATILGGYATVLLVLVNLVVLSQNQNLITESRKSRQAEEDRYREQQATELQTLRQSLLAEIQAAENLDKYAESYSVNSSVVSDLFPRTVYEENAGNLGRLSTEERDVVIQYYSKAKLIEASIEAQRRQDYPGDKDAVTDYFDTIRLTLEHLFYRLTLGWAKPAHEKRADQIRAHLESLNEIQNEAVEALETRLGQNS